MYTCIYTHVYMKHQSKPHVYKSDIAPCCRIQNLPSTQNTRKQQLPSTE